MAHLVERWGGAVSTALLDPVCSLYCIPGVDGAIGYRRGPGSCAVAIGDPVCAPADLPRLLHGFRSGFRSTAFCCATPDFTRVARMEGWASLEFGAELILDPRRDPCRGRRAHELRKKLNRARRAGLVVEEYRRFPADPTREAQLDGLVAEWLRGRKGPQIFLAGVHLFDPPDGKRWFVATLGGRVVGLLSLMHLQRREGWLLDHLMALPDAPGGTTESLVAHVLARLGEEGCAYATFGPAPRANLGAIDGLGAVSEKLARGAYATVARMFHLESRTRYRLKFGESTSVPSYVLLDPPQLGFRQLLAIMRAFNVSLAM